MGRNRESRQVREGGYERTEKESILGYRRCGSFVEDRYRLRERGAHHRTGASEKSEKESRNGSNSEIA